MRETSKAMRRRVGELERDEFPWDEVFKGYVCDVGSGDDPLNVSSAEIITHVDLPDGGGDNLLYQVKDRKFDCIHGSQVLEHAIDPVVMLRSWIECLKPGGYIVATVPDWKLYEKCVWPSRWNAGHRSTWSMGDEYPSSGVVANRVGDKIYNRQHCKLPEWLYKFPVEILLCRLVDTNYDYDLGPDIDQTFNFQDGVECFIEMVLQKH